MRMLRVEGAPASAENRVVNVFLRVYSTKFALYFSPLKTEFFLLFLSFCRWIKSGFPHTIITSVCFNLEKYRCFANWDNLL